jgi:hypothetical protein
MVSQDEKKWLKKFYEGTFLVKGWNDRSKELVKNFEGSQRTEMSRLLEDLGGRIGGEWVKNNSIRRIDTDMLQHWGETLKTAKAYGPQALMDQIQAIDSEIDALLG